MVAERVQSSSWSWLDNWSLPQMYDTISKYEPAGAFIPARAEGVAERPSAAAKAKRVSNSVRVSILPFERRLLCTYIYLFVCSAVFASGLLPSAN